MSLDLKKGELNTSTGFFITERFLLRLVTHSTLPPSVTNLWCGILACSKDHHVTQQQEDAEERPFEERMRR